MALPPDVREKSQVSRSLYGQRDLPLALGTRTADPPGDNPTIIANELAQKPGVLIIKEIFTNTGFTELPPSHHGILTPPLRTLHPLQPPYSLSASCGTLCAVRTFQHASTRGRLARKGSESQRH